MQTAHHSKIKLNCRYQKLLNLYADDCLDAQEHLRMQNHLRSCNLCTQKLRTVKNSQLFISESVPKKRLEDQITNELIDEIREILILQNPPSNKPESTVMRDCVHTLFTLGTIKAYCAAFFIFLALKTLL
jgi:hypothetical protein